MLGIKSHGFCHDNGGGARDRDKRYNEVFLLDLLHLLLGYRLRGVQRKNRANERRRTAGSYKLQESPPRQVVTTKDCPLYRRFDSAVQTLLRRLGSTFVLITFLDCHRFTSPLVSDLLSDVPDASLQ